MTYEKLKKELPELFCLAEIEIEMQGKKIQKAWERYSRQGNEFWYRVMQGEIKTIPDEFKAEVKMHLLKTQLMNKVLNRLLLEGYSLSFRQKDHKRIELVMVKHHKGREYKQSTKFIHELIEMVDANPIELLLLESETKLNDFINRLP